MKTVFRTVLAAFLSVLALSAVAAGVAQAEEAPYFKVAGAKLKSGESAELKATSPREVTFAAGGAQLKCSLTFTAGSKLLGASLGNPGTIETTIELSACSNLERGGITCKVTSEHVKSQLLLARLVAAEKKKGALEAWFQPKTGPEFIKVPLERECRLGESFRLAGSYVVEIYSAGSLVQYGKEPAEAKTLELSFPASRISHVWNVVNEVGAEATGMQLTWTGLEEPILIQNTSRPLFELASGANWGVFV